MLHHESSGASKDGDAGRSRSFDVKHDNGKSNTFECCVGEYRRCRRDSVCARLWPPSPCPSPPFRGRGDGAGRERLFPALSERGAVLTVCAFRRRSGERARCAKRTPLAPCRGRGGGGEGAGAGRSAPVRNDLDTRRLLRAVRWDWRSMSRRIMFLFAAPRPDLRYREQSHPSQRMESVASVAARPPTRCSDWDHRSGPVAERSRTGCEDVAKRLRGGAGRCAVSPFGASSPFDRLRVRNPNGCAHGRARLVLSLSKDGAEDRAGRARVTKCIAPTNGNLGVLF
jgi:hypothetical protein